MLPVRNNSEMMMCYKRRERSEQIRVVMAWNICNAALWLWDQKILRDLGWGHHAIHHLNESHAKGEIFIQWLSQPGISYKKEPLFIRQIRESIFWTSPHLNSVLIPNDRHFIFNNNHLLFCLRTLSNLAVGSHSNMAGRRFAVCDRGAIC